MAAPTRLKEDQRIKVMYLLDTYIGPYAGTEKQLLSLINNLDRSRFAPCLTVLRPTPYLEQNKLPCPVEILDIPRIRSPGTAIKLWRYACSLVRRRFSVVHVLFNDASVVAPFFLRLAGLRVVVSRRDMGFWYTRGNLRLLRLNRFFVDKVVTNSRAVKRNVEQAEGFPTQKIQVIYNGYQPANDPSSSPAAVRTRLGVDGNASIVGVVANLRPIKRLVDLIDAFSLVLKAHPASCLVLVGDGEERKNLERRARSLGIESAVRFAGRVPYTLPFVREFTVGVLCSESEGFPNAVIEYMYCGKPTVCTDAGGASEIVQHGVNGFLVPVGDVAAMAEYVTRLLDDENLATNLGNAARERVRIQCSLEGMIRAHSELYAALTASPRRPMR
jgi:glycosyltransferase involved in cell wall biosynthesis